MPLTLRIEHENLLARTLLSSLQSPIAVYSVGLLPFALMTYSPSWQGVSPGGGEGASSPSPLFQRLRVASGLKYSLDDG